MEQLLEQVYATELIEWLATGTALAYVWLAARDSNWCWFFAAVSALLWGYQSFVIYRLVSDALLQVFYLVMAGVGLFRWHRARAARPDNQLLDTIALPSEPSGEAGIQRMSPREHAITLAMGLAVGLLLGYVVGAVATATQTYLDAITTSFSIIATFLLIWRKLENWLYWVVIDAVYVYIYLRSGAVLFALLMILYVVMAVYGYFKWRSSVDRGHQTAR